jgi:hypothetical protein
VFGAPFLRAVLASAVADGIRLVPAVGADDAAQAPGMLNDDGVAEPRANVHDRLIG